MVVGIGSDQKPKISLRPDVMGLQSVTGKQTEREERPGYAKAGLFLLELEE